MLNEFSSLGKQIAYAAVFALVVCAVLLAIRTQASGDDGQRVTDTQALISLVAQGRLAETRPASAQTIIDRYAATLARSGNQTASEKLLKTARNHALVLNKIAGGYEVVGFSGRSQSGQYFSYRKAGRNITQTCNGGLGCQSMDNSNIGSWQFTAIDCPSVGASCEAQPQRLVAPTQ